MLSGSALHHSPFAAPLQNHDPHTELNNLFSPRSKAFMICISGDSGPQEQRYSLIHTSYLAPHSPLLSVHSHLTPSETLSARLGLLQRYYL